jgi:hypothetical protein
VTIVKVEIMLSGGRRNTSNIVNEAPTNTRRYSYTINELGQCHEALKGAGEEFPKDRCRVGWGGVIGRAIGLWRVP